MNRRRLATLLMVALVAYSGYGFACSRANLTAYAQDVVSALNDTLPILQNAGISTGKIQTAIVIGNKLVTAFQNHADNDAVTLTGDLITAFEGIVADADLIQNPQTKQRVIVVLAIAQIALHYISNHLQSAGGGITASRRGGSPAAATITNYAKKPVWRCRSAQTGKFQKMEWCRAHPDVSTVERF